MKRFFLCIYVCLAALLCGAQQTNVIKVPDIAALADRETSLCIYLNNMSNDIVAMQMELMLPQGMTIDASSAALSNRAVDHVLQVKPTNGGYRFMVYSPQNQPLRGNSGLLLTVNARLDDQFLSDNEYPMTISGATLGDSDGNNVLTSTECGSIIIQPSPDFVVTTLTASPQNISPEGEIMLSWTVKNQGLVASTGGWSEQILLVDDNGGKILLGRTFFDDPLQAGEAISRQATIKVPQLPGLEGNVKAQIQLAPNRDSGERPENQTNNTKTSGDILFLSKYLFLEMPTMVSEGNRTATCKLLRSGSWQNEESFSFTLTGDDRLTVPQIVTIAQGSSSAYYNLVITDNELLDNDSIFKISIEGNGYPVIQQQLIIEDNEYPNLALSASKSQLTEGETFQLTVSTSRVSMYPITVTISSENSKRFNFPATVTIPAGKTSVTFDVTAVDDELPSLELSNAFTASAPKHNKAEVIVLLGDNDLPVLEMTLTPTTVSENAGVVAGVLRRTTHTDSKITVKLTDDANGGLYFGNRTLSLDKGVQEVHFNFGPVDNAQVDGDRTYNITAAVWLSSCNCGASGESAGYTTTQLQVLDNDGAALGLSSSASTLKEGGKTTLTISRNTDTASALTVTLSSDYSEGLTYPTTVTIPAGQKSTTVEVTSTGNNVQGDSHNVIFTVQSNGYAKGTCFITVTDQTKPDAVISAVRVNSYDIEVGEKVSLSVVVANKGVATLPSHTALNIGCSGISKRETIYTPADLAVGDSVILVSDYILPITATGTYTLTAIVNPDQYVTELNYYNNTLSSTTITVRPNFTATVTVDRQVYHQGETVAISGQTSAGGRNTNVEVFLVNNGARQSLTLKADEEGRFQTTYQPYDRQAGHFVVGACYPGTGETSGSAEFDVYGLLLSASYATHDINIGDEVKGSFVIKNPGLLPQTGLQIEQQAEPDGCDFSIGQISSIDADGQLEVSYSLNANEVTQGNDWLQIPLLINSSEGCTKTFTVYYYIRSPKGKLKASQTRIETTMTKGKPREYQLQVSNIGRGETGTISLSLPSWIESVTPREIPSISQGDTVTVVLRMVPTDNMQLNVPVTGQIGINCKNGDGVAINLNVMPVSETTGRLLIDVVDEYSFYAEGNPHVEGAQILVKHPTTGQVITQGKTASDGRYSVELQEGWYTVSINADKHQGYQTTLEVAPGKDTGKQIFLTYEAISYNWEVVETEVEDEYEIETVVKYETNVPKPVIVLSLPDEKPEVGSVIAVVATNKGLISAKNVDVTLSVNDGLELEWLTDPSLAELAPQQSAVFYAVLKESKASQARSNALSDVAKTIVCLTLYYKLLGYYVCGDYEKAIAVESSRAWGKCISSKGSTVSGGVYGGGGSWSGGGGSSSSSSHPSSSPGGSSNSTYAGYWSSGTTSPTAKICHEKDIEEPLTLPDIIEPTEPGVANCGEAVIGDFMLIPAEGPIRKVKGVAADGASQVLIMLDGSSKLPVESDQCQMMHNWTLLEEGIGKLENTDCWYGVKYTAPDDFPGGPNENTYTVHAILEFYDGDQIGIHSVPIEIKRAPVVLLHGLGVGIPSLGLDVGGSEKTWKGFRDKLIESGMYSPYQVLNKGYEDSYKLSFKDNERTASERIDRVIDQYLSNEIVAKKVDLFGHSMGGILARLHVQYVDNTNIHKLITVNTPHSGSRVANFSSLLMVLQKSNNGYIDLLNSLFDTEISEMDWSAYDDLGTNSPATLNYLNNAAVLDRMNDIPIHAIVSENYLEEVDWSGNVMDIFWDVFSIDQFYLADIWVEGSSSEGNDGMVPVKSQRGGLELPYYSYFLNQNHSSTDNPDVQKKLIDLLNATVKKENNAYFCFTGFRPDILPLARKQHVNHTNIAFARKQSSEKAPTVIASVSDNKLIASITGTEGYDNKMLLAKFGSDAFCIVRGTKLECEIPASLSGEVTVYGAMSMNGEDILWNYTLVNIAAPQADKNNISISDISLYYGESKPVILTCTWSDGSQTYVTPDGATFTDNLVSYANGVITGLHGGSGTATFTYQGLTCEAPFTVYNFGKNDDEESSKSVCSTITLKLSQTMTMTRQAFRGTLTVFNGNENASMRDVRLNLQVTNTKTGQVASSHEFQINAESLDGFSGEVDLTSGWTLAGNTTGTATALFIPTRYAAPTEPIEWSFGGTLSYIDPFTGLEVTRDLYPVTLTVKPAPELDLTYFMQRDIYGDDPLTLDVVEPTVPAEFALLINNIGYGDATNVRMVTQQPEIIENEKGLHIDFKLISSQVNGGDAALSFGQSIANNFGTIPAHSQMYAQWWLQSSLLGHFTDYDVKATHVTSYGNEDLSLLGNVTIHELIHGFNLAADEHGQTQRAFLVNDISDADDLPDNLYFSNGDIASVTITTTAEIVRKSSTEYELTITPSAMGWNYGSVMDPTYGYAELKSIVRKSDGKELGNTHFWQTDRTLRDSKDWLYEYRLHFIDEFKGTSPVIYVLTFDPVPDTVLEVKSIGDIPEEGSIAETPIDALNVTFSKEINATTFTGDDITFAVQGVKKEASQIVISTEDNKTFKLDMKAMNDTLSNGYYTLTVQTSGITDLEGYQGREGKQVGWIMFRGGLVQLLTTAYPENSGTVTRKTVEPAGIRGLAPSGEDPNTARYGSTVILMAEPCEGYEFANWTLNGEIVSNEPEYEAFAISDLDIVANFTKKSYMVNVESEYEGGTITGSGTGFYEYEATLELAAVPNEDYAFKNWIVNGKTIAGKDGKLTLTVNQASDIQAVFEREYYCQTMTLAKGWNWISTYLLEPMDVNELTAYANRILSQTEELINDPEYGMIGNIKEFTPGKAYKLEATRMFSSTFRGHLFNAETSSITLKKGWNWIAYPYQEQALIDDVIGNASDGDYITSQIGFAEYSNGSWEGSLDTFIPGNGYLYKSATEKNLSFEFSETVAQSRARAHTTNAQLSNKSIVDIHRYPSTMNMTIQLFRDGMLVSADEYNIYAMANDEIRGVSIQIGDKHYLTVFGADPVEVSFIVEYIETGETFEAKEILKFQDDVVGSRKNPFALNIGNGTGIEFMSNDDHPMTIYSLQGVLIGKEATLKMLHSLPKGVYIVNGKKCFIK